jgi:hypothetical protein
MRSTLYSEEIQQLITTLHAVRQVLENVNKPPDQVILDDVDLCNLLKFSKRTSPYWRERGEITYSKLGGKIYYRLADVLSLIERNELHAVKPNF